MPNVHTRDADRSSTFTGMAMDAYARIAPYYDAILGRINAPLNRLMVEVAAAAPGARVLDVGCGTGGLLSSYAAAGATCFGIDLSPAMLDVARDRLPDANLRVADATDIPFPDGSFDLSAASLVLHEMDAQVARAVVHEMVRVTAPGGRVAVLDYRHGSMRWQGRGWRAFSTGTELLAGVGHFRAWRRWLGGGGMDAVEADGADVDTERPVAGGNLAIRVLTVR